MENKVYLKDCIEGMKEYPDKHFDLAIVDPPYGIDAAQDERFGVKTKKAGSRRTNYGKKSWDSSTPDEEYFEQLFRVSKNQIIWGANYFGLIGGMLFWHKNQTSYTSSNGEIAFLSMKYGVDYVNILWHGAYQQDMKNKEQRIHPTQKPVSLYDWLLSNYAKEGDLILDTHLGSGSSRIAAYKGGFNFVGFEIDKEYYEKQEKRFNDFKSQLTLF
jgi:site-specific DNA-methyltransferase (adenine-specific)